MEITLLEDPACYWCWAFQPVITALEFEVGLPQRIPFRLRRVMGGLRDQHLGDPSFLIRHWQTAAEMSGMPFNTVVLERYIPRTTYEACRLIKAALPLGQRAADRLLRRIREAFHVEGARIDDLETLLELARGLNLDCEALRENLQNGRAEALFDRDRREASDHRFGFPTLLIRRHPTDPPLTLNGVVSYGDVLEAMAEAGMGPQNRRRFQDRPEDWRRLFSIHPRLTVAELQQVTRLRGEELEEALRRNGIRREGAFHFKAAG